MSIPDRKIGLVGENGRIFKFSDCQLPVAGFQNLHDSRLQYFPSSKLLHGRFHLHTTRLPAVSFVSVPYLGRTSFTNVPNIIHTSSISVPYMSRSFKGTRHIRDMYEICTAHIRDIGEAEANMTRYLYTPNGLETGALHT